MGSRFDGLLVFAQVIKGAAVGNDAAIGKGLGARHMIEMPVAQDNGKFCDAAFGQGFANELAMGNGDMGVIDDGFMAADDGITGNAERQCTIINPVVNIGKTLSLHPAIIKRHDIGVRFENAEV